RIVGEFESTTAGEGERQVQESVRTGLADWGNLYRQYLVHARNKDFLPAHDILKDQMEPAMSAISKSSETLAERERKALWEVAAASKGQVGTSRWICLAVSAIGLLAALVIMAVVRRSFARLRKIAVRLEDETKQVAGAAHQVAGASESIAQGASQQAATLEQTASAGREIQATAQRNLESAESAAAATGAVSRRVAEAN